MVLKRIASLGLVVVAVIHQPRAEIVNELDDVLLLRPGGEPLYNGPQTNMVKYFEDMGFQVGYTYLQTLWCHEIQYVSRAFDCSQFSLFAQKLCICCFFDLALSRSTMVRN